MPKVRLLFRNYAFETRKKKKKSKSFIHCYCSMLFSLSRVKHTFWWNTTYNCHFVAHENENWDWCNLNFRWTHFSEQRTTQYCGNRLPLRQCKIEKRLNCRSNLKLIYLRDQESHDSGNFPSKTWKMLLRIAVLLPVKVKKLCAFFFSKYFKQSASTIYEGLLSFIAEFVSSHFQIRSYEPVIVCYDQFVSLISLIVNSL